MKVNYIKCMDFEFTDVDVLNVSTDIELNKAIENHKVICVVDEDGERDYINTDYIMYWG